MSQTEQILRKADTICTGDRTMDDEDAAAFAISLFVHLWAGHVLSLVRDIEPEKWAVEKASVTVGHEWADEDRYGHQAVCVHCGAKRGEQST